MKTKTATTKDRRLVGYRLLPEVQRGVKVAAAMDGKSAAEYAEQVLASELSRRGLLHPAPSQPAA